MPYVDGREVARTVKRESPDTPVILLTGWGTRLDAEGEIPFEVDTILTKPPRVSEMRRALTAVRSKTPRDLQGEYRHEGGQGGAPETRGLGDAFSGGAQ